MKQKLLLFTVLASVLFAGVSCSNENEIKPSAEKASITVRLAGEKMMTRATTAATEEENAILNYMIYVFYPNGVLESSEAATTLEGLTTGNKKIAVVVNAPSGFPQSPITNYADFKDELFELGTQTPENIIDNGLAMSGEITPSLNPGENELTIPVSRIVAKIKLGTVTITPDTEHGGVFELTNVSIMKAKSYSDMGLPTVVTGGDLYGGIDPEANDLTTESEYKSYLRGAAEEGSNDTYFYIFPNDGGSSNADATLMTLEGTYNGVKTYFPFIINDPVSNPTSGNYVERNTIHTVNVTLKKVWTGTENPEELVDDSSIEVTIQAQDWETVPTQEVEW